MQIADFVKAGKNVEPVLKGRLLMAIACLLTYTIIAVPNTAV
jgi:hypothetical protein